MNAEQEKQLEKFLSKPHPDINGEELAFWSEKTGLTELDLIGLLRARG